MADQFLYEIIATRPLEKQEQEKKIPPGAVVGKVKATNRHEAAKEARNLSYEGPFCVRCTKDRRERKKPRIRKAATTVVKKPDKKKKRKGEITAS